MDKQTTDAFMRVFNIVQTDVHETAMEKGWWDNERDVGDLIALLHTEVSEAYEAVRHGNPPDDKVSDFDGLTAELADVIIRIMDMAAGLDLRVAEALIAKIKFNKTRSYRHGGKRF